jgi:carboxymethylenebutenolidase
MFRRLAVVGAKTKADMMRRFPAMAALIPIAASAAVLANVTGGGAEEGGALPERVSFPSADGRTMLVGYVYAPGEGSDAHRPAVVMMHGRAGAYSTLAKGRYEAATLSQRHQMWGRLWAANGYIAVLVDGFGPRGYPQGFPRFSYASRPVELDEVTIRPLDAYGALAYLRRRPDVAGDRIGLQGWSNGGSAALATLSVEAPGGATRAPEDGFRAALVFYPACGLKGQFAAGGYRPYAPVRIFHGTGDEEVSFRHCADLVARSRMHGGDIEIRPYRGATHGFDDPGRARQRLPANADAKQDAMVRAQRFFAEQLAAPPAR